MVEQNAKKGLAFADVGYVLVSGETAIADEGDKLLKKPRFRTLVSRGIKLHHRRI